MHTGYTIHGCPINYLFWYIANISARGCNMSNDDDYLNKGIILLSWFPFEMIWCIDTCAADPCIIDELESNSDEVGWIACDVYSFWYHIYCSGLSEQANPHCFRCVRH